LKGALLRTLHAADIASIRAFAVHAKDDEARSFADQINEFEYLIAIALRPLRIASYKAKTGEDPQRRVRALRWSSSWSWKSKLGKPSSQREAVK
jgi:hypothetical protein